MYVCMFMLLGLSGRRDFSHEQFTRYILTNKSHKFEFVRPVPGTKFLSLRLDFEAEMVNSHEGNCPRDLLQGPVRSCVPTFMLKDFEIKSFCCSTLFLYYIKQVDSMLPCVCSVIDHRRRQNVVRTSVTRSAIASCVIYVFLQYVNIICDLFLNRRTATWNLFVF